MTPAYACRLPLGADPDDPGRSPFATARAVARHALTRPFGGWPDQADVRRGRWEPEPGVVLEWRSVAHGDDAVWVASSEQPAPDRSVLVRTEVHLGVEGGAASAYVSRTLRSASPLVTALPDLRVSAPAVVPALLGALHVSDGGARLTDHPVIVGSDAVRTLARLVADRDRACPVIAVASDAGAIDVPRLAAQLAGLAHVHVVDGRARQALAEWFGDDQRLPDGALRIWWPGWSYDDREPDHPISWPREWAGDAHSAASFVDRTTRSIFAAAAVRVPAPDLEGRLLAAVESDRRERVRVEAPVADMTAALRAAWAQDRAELEAARADLDDTRLELELARIELNEISAKWADALVAFAVEYDTERRPVAGRDPRDMREAVEMAAAQCRHVVFLPSAYESAAQSPFRRPGDVLRDLRKLDAVVHEWRTKGLPAGFMPACMDAGLAWANDVSATALRKYPEDYQRVYDGEPIVLGPHLKFGSGAPERHCRVYCYVDRAKQVVVVGHVGRHLRDASTT